MSVGVVEVEVGSGRQVFRTSDERNSTYNRSKMFEVLIHTG